MVEASSGADASPIVLAGEPEFDIANLRVRPRRLDVCWQERRHEIEPRVMQVLLALAKAEEEVVSREELADLCWGGRVVGDHSLNRCIHALRHLARMIDPPPFAIETIARIGYRLVRCRTAADDIQPPAQGELAAAPAPLDSSVEVPAAPSAMGRRKNGFRLAAATALLIAVVATSWVVRSGDDAAVSVAIVDARDDPASALAKDFGADLMRLAGGRADEMALTANPREAKFVVRASLKRGGQMGRGDVALLDGHGGKVLWAGSVEVPPQQLADIRLQIAAKLGNVLFCAVRTSATGARLDTATSRLYLAACERMDLPDKHLIGLLRRVTERAPHFAEGWAELATAEANLHTRALEDPGSVPSGDLAAAARSHLTRARDIDPQLAATYVAEAELLPARQFARRIAILEAGIKENPDHAPLHAYLAHALFEVGRTTEAIAAAQQAAALNPLSSASRSVLIGSLANAGNIPKARRTLADAERIWPASRNIMNARFSLELRYGDARKAQDLIDRGEAMFGGPSGGFRGPRIVMAARLDPSPENVARLIKFAAFDARRVPQAAPLRLQSLGQFGAVEEAYHVTGQPGVIRHLGMATEILFRPTLREFRYDQRFLGVAARLGLVRYWQTTGAWPDFCSDPHLPYDCREQTSRLVGRDG